MARIAWGAVGERFFEVGVDRGVLYPKVGNGVPWNGLVAVREAPTGGEPQPIYYDGYKVSNLASAEEFAATIDAFSSPAEFGPCEGVAAIHNGLFVTEQRRESFGLSYRSRVGNDIKSSDHGYKVHVVYNARVSSADRSYQTIGEDVEPNTLSWPLVTKPPLIPGWRPTAHMVVDSRFTDPTVLSELEDILYGSSTTMARLPDPSELIALFA